MLIPQLFSDADQQPTFVDLKVTFALSGETFNYQQKNTAAQSGVKLLIEHFRLKFTWKHQGMEGKPGHLLPLLDRNSEDEFLRQCRAKISQQPSCLNMFKMLID